MPVKNKFYLSYLVFLLFALSSVSSATAESRAKDSLATSDDCTDISVNYKNNPNLTRQEKIGLMDKALFHSLNKYEGCQRASANTASGGGGADNGQTGSDNNGESKGSGSSTASSDMSGTETPAAQQASTDDSSDRKNLESMPVNGKTGPVQNTQTRGSGKIPDDIPAVDNDSVLEAQIRHAAMIETDPVIKEKLWNEYRKYKGLPARTSHH